MVNDYNGTGSADFSAWGTCNGGDWCCYVKDDVSTQEINTVVLRGSPGDDILDFEDSASGTYMRPHAIATSINPLMGGRDGTDELHGSPYTGPGYYEELRGEDGNDTIDGDAGRDMLRGGNGTDTIHGGDGNDRMRGGDGVDTLMGQAGNDTYCDTSGNSASACAANIFDETGGSGDDRFWLDYYAACDPAGNLTPGSTADVGTDECGPAASGAWGTTPWTGCDTDIYSEPTQCP